MHISLFFLLFLGFPFSAYAIIGHGGNYITDYDHGRDFLNLSITQGHSFDEVFENIRAGSGWRLASTYMIEDLVNSAGITPGISQDDPRNYNSMQALIFQVGETLTHLTYSASFGVARGEGQFSGFTGAALIADILKPDSGVYYYTYAGQLGGSIPRDYSQSEYGIWLYRDCNCYFEAFNEEGKFRGWEFISDRPALELSSVFSKPLPAIPEPQSYMMLSFGILLILGAHRRQGDCTYSSSTVIQHSRAFAHMPLKLPPRKIRSQSATYAPIL